MSNEIKPIAWMDDHGSVHLNQLAAAAHCWNKAVALYDQSAIDRLKAKRDGYAQGAKIEADRGDRLSIKVRDLESQLAEYKADSYPIDDEKVRAAAAVIKSRLARGMSGTILPADSHIESAFVLAIAAVAAIDAARKGDA